MENSIKEDIKIVENYLANSAINEIDSNFFKNGGWEIVDLEIPKSMQHILSDYERILKENKKKDKQIEQYQNILATNDMLHVIECENKYKIIDLMAEQLTTPIHDKEWIKKYYENKAKELLNK